MIGKLDFNGDLVWMKKYVVVLVENIGKDIIELFDGSFVVVGYVVKDEIDIDILVVKFDVDGEKEWYFLVGDF